MAIRVWRHRLLVGLGALLLTDCAAPPPADTEMITWYAVNPGSSLRIVLYDVVCNRRIGSLRLSARRETPVTTCAGEDGRADVRYRPHGYATRVQGWTYNKIRPDQRVYMQ